MDDAHARPAKKKTQMAAGDRLRNSAWLAPEISSFSRVRRSFSDPGAGLHRPLCSAAAGWPQQRQQASGVGLAAAPAWLTTAAAATAGPCSPSCSAAGADDAGSPTLSGSRSTCSKRERESSDGWDDSSSPHSPGSDGAGDRSGVVWLKLLQLARRNKVLEQQLAEHMQATHISGIKQPPPAVQQLAAAAVAAAGRPAVAMEVDCRGSGQPHDPVAASDCHPLQHPSLPVQQQQQQQQPGQQDSRQQQEVQRLQREVQRLQGLNAMLQNDNADLELVLRETERQRREFAARFAFMTLDTDNDGYVSVAQVEAYELFSCYAPCLLRTAFALWPLSYASFLTIDDFTRFVDFSEDRTTREAHEFWFSVLDADRDGRLSWLDCRQAYDAVDKSLAAGGGVIAFEDLMCQLRDMVPRQARPEAGFTLQELWDSKLGGGVLGLLTNANNMLLQRSTAEWNRGEFPL